jgi:hypothetical protein
MPTGKKTQSLEPPARTQSGHSKGSKNKAIPSEADASDENPNTYQSYPRPRWIGIAVAVVLVGILSLFTIIKLSGNKEGGDRWKMMKQ